jgi:hypothetical protein
MAMAMASSQHARHQLQCALRTLLTWTPSAPGPVFARRSPSALPRLSSGTVRLSASLSGAGANGESAAEGGLFCFTKTRRSTIQFVHTKPRVQLENSSLHPRRTTSLRPYACVAL